MYAIGSPPAALTRATVSNGTAFERRAHPTWHDPSTHGDAGRRAANTSPDRRPHRSCHCRMAGARAVAVIRLLICADRRFAIVAVGLCALVGHESARVRWWPHCSSGDGRPRATGHLAELGSVLCPHPGTLLFRTLLR